MNRSPLARAVAGAGAGAVAGLLATVPQTLAMQAVRLALPGPRGRFVPRQVTEAVLARVTPGRRRPSLSEPAWWAATAASHFAFGAAAGAVFPLLPPVPRWAPLRGTIWGLAVWAVSYGVVLPAAGIRGPQGDRPVRKNLQLVAAHLAWGLATAVLFDRLSDRLAAAERVPPVPQLAPVTRPV